MKLRDERSLVTRCVSRAASLSLGTGALSMEGKPSRRSMHSINDATCLTMLLSPYAPPWVSLCAVVHVVIGRTFVCHPIRRANDARHIMSPVFAYVRWHVLLRCESRVSCYNCIFTIVVSTTLCVCVHSVLRSVLVLSGRNVYNEKLVDVQIALRSRYASFR